VAFLFGKGGRDILCGGLAREDEWADGHAYGVAQTGLGVGL